MKRRKLFKIVFAATIVYLVLELGSKYYFELTHLSNPTLPVFVARDKKIADELGAYPPFLEWPVYTEDRMQLTFKYPPGWEVAIPSSSKGKSDHDVLRISDKKEAMSGIIIERFGDEYSNKVQIENVLNDRYFQREKIQINGLEFERLLITDESDNKSVSEYYFLNEDYTPVKFRLYNHYGLSHLRELELEMDNILRKIMSSMKKTI